ncbi:MAG: hypothetical protein ABIG32_01070 [Candidatus Uhrbacteria bacterium]|nr:hypothetical protein [Patescibacteria group bacterium]MBU1906902.1 hypothetical protein [Patescibacteria group bacterium]
MSLPYTIEATVHEFTDDSVVISLDDGQKISLPKALVSDNVTVGGTVHLAVFSDQDVAAERERFAKDVLNELLQGE